ncbi:MAG: ADP-ribosyl-[dinitrogen reductase] hydrolase [Thiomonas sp.]|uniref:ADP-ribosyl-[dinitrogen reductase] hydrolase n=1 Tax=Thiomonas sp. TaxID=2047785 RepID=UPI002A370B27|nr:ADP-ribosyl-[dinitrogen reductase] hydrolase [Thiomonas sp.]MDY0329808.1 ADP-ribosyl-[dinitrogen reductase] hydrolase [Thiomonas sp.]
MKPSPDSLRARPIVRPIWRLASRSNSHGTGFDPIVDRALGAYLGLAIGDALGATVEFMTPDEIVRCYGVHRRIVGGGWLGLAPGQVTDDTTMSLALGDALVRSGGWSLDAVAASFADWLRARPVDCGNTCRRGIRRYLADGSLATSPNEGDAGNGALMRNLPVVLSTLNDDEAWARRSIAQAHVTHNHPLSDAAVLALGEMTRRLVKHGDTAACAAVAASLVRAHPEFRFDPYPGRASGYVVDTVQTVLHYFFNHARFEFAVTDAVNRGEDADTTGALVGMLAGARCGARALPRHWLDRVDRNVVRAIVAQTPALLALGRSQEAHQ